MSNKKYVRICAWCQRVQAATGQWEAIPIPEEVRITHGICPECEKEAEEELEK